MRNKCSILVVILIFCCECSHVKHVEYDCSQQYSQAEVMSIIIMKVENLLKSNGFDLKDFDREIDEEPEIYIFWYNYKGGGYGAGAKIKVRKKDCMIIESDIWPN